MKPLFVMTMLTLVVSSTFAQSENNPVYPKPDYIIAHELYNQGYITHRFTPFSGQGLVTALASSLVTGSGQMINGQVGKGVVLLICGVSGYAIAYTAESANTGVPGLLIWLGAGIVSMVDAAVVSTKNNRTFKNARYKEYRKVTVNPTMGLQPIAVTDSKIAPTLGFKVSF